MKLQNEFNVTRIDLKTFDFPKAEVKVWSSLFDKGGSVDIEAQTPEGHPLTLYKDKIEENRSVVAEREYAQELADEWNENCKENWLNEIIRCLGYVKEYQQKKVNDFDKEVETLKAYKASLNKAKRLIKS